MPSIRVGFSSDLNITGGNTGIGTATPTARLEVSNGIVAERAAGSGGISTFKEYQGFNQTLATLPHEIVTEEGVFSSLTGEIKIIGETTVSSGSTVEVGKTKTLTVTDRFAVPLGETNNRDNAPEAGTTRFNQDFGTLEFFDGVNWKTVNSYARYHVGAGSSTSSGGPGAAGRALFGGGTSPGPSTRVDWIEYVQISTLGNSQDFGDLTQARESVGACASSVRGVFSGGLQSAPLNRDEIDYVTIASSGNAVDFGNITDSGRRVQSSVSSSTRAVNLGGYKDSISQNVNIMDYIEIATTGDAIDFGDVTTKRRAGGSCSSPTRGIYAGGFGSVAEKIIEYLTIASKGNTVRFGELINAGYSQMGFSNGVRGIMGGGNQDGSASGNRTFIASITIASEGNAIHFGDLTVARDHGAAESNLIRGVFAGGQSGPTRVNVIDYFSISTGGDALDFGDLSAGIRKGCSGLSDSHGGLGGF